MTIADIIAIAAFGGITLLAVVLAWASWDEGRRKTRSQ